MQIKAAHSRFSRFSTNSPLSECYQILPRPCLPLDALTEMNKVRYILRALFLVGTDCTFSTARYSSRLCLLNDRTALRME